MAEVHIGGCLCQGVRYEFTDAPLMTVNCYCRDCQKATGSPFATVLALPRTAFRLLHGELGAFTVKSNGGRDVTREFCKVCSSPLFTKAEMVPDLIFVKAGSLDDSSWLSPVLNCWTSRKEPWMPVASDIQNFPKNPELDKSRPDPLSDHLRLRSVLRSFILYSLRRFGNLSLLLFYKMIGLAIPDYPEIDQTGSGLLIKHAGG